MRNLGLDLLRLLAVSLVMFRHLPGDVGRTAELAILFRGGWIGVDLFFVLSGFLISGLLFREHQKTGRLDVVHFLIRRGFKIYPAFWALLAVTIVILTVVEPKIPGRALAGEIFFLQNYLGGLL
ncbi:MAG: acyltransferase family protein, partial [Longimicrobiales bacterium]|nr:acyltransferase family protein [Longimicrobiales bacterium]